MCCRYHDGMIATNLGAAQIRMKKLFFPKWWLNATGYFNHHGHMGPGVILFDPSPEAEAIRNQESVNYTTTLLLTALVSSILTVMATVYALNSNKREVRHEYTPISSANL